MNIAIPSPKITNLDETLDYAWLGLGDINEIIYDNHLLAPEWDEADKIPELVVKLCRDPNYLHFFAKYILNIDLLPFQCVILQMLWGKRFPLLVATRGGSKSFMLAVYIIMRAVLQPGCRIVVVGASLRQSMVLFNYLETIWNGAPILRDIVAGGKKTAGPKKDLHMAFWECGRSKVIFLPLGQGDKIRGQRANVVIADEFASISRPIFETVIRGFASVKSDGVFAHVVKAAKRKVAQELGMELPSEKDMNISQTALDGNQLVLAGTAYFQFNHFYHYFEYYRAIILSGGDKEKIKRDFPDMDIPDNVDPSDYAILRLPYDVIPAGMMDDAILQHGRATMDTVIFDMEYGASFPSESDGFYLASSLNAATCPIKFDDGDPFTFPAKLLNDSGNVFIMGIDPASENDNFTINVIEMFSPTRRGTVYQWVTNRKDFEDLKNKGMIDASIQDYNTFCVKHIRDLVRRFNIQLIMLDAGGGGVSIREGLRDPDKMLPGEEPILDMDDLTNAQVKGRRILKLIEFSDSKWRRDAHYGLRKDIMDKVLLFPEYDAAAIAESNLADSDRVYDTLEDTYMEIMECKTEMTLIQHSQTNTGSEKWDVPRIQGLDSEEIKKTLKKDRFTSILLANWGCRIYDNLSYVPPDDGIGIVRRSAGVGFFNSPVVKDTSQILRSSGGGKICF